MQRTDIHTPSNIVASDYTYLVDFGSINIGAEERMEFGDSDEALARYIESGVAIHSDSIYQCDVCGAAYYYGSLFQHKNGEVISLGHQCAEKMGLAYDLAAAGRIKDAAKAFRKASKKRTIRKAKLRMWVAGNLGTAPTKELLEALNTAREHYIISDIRAGLIKWIDGSYPGLSVKQAALVIKIAADMKAKAEAPAENHIEVPVDGERIAVVGTVVSSKIVDTAYGSTTKITVKVETEAGSWLCYGTAPSAFFYMLQDLDRVAYEAWIEGGNEGECPKNTQLRGQKVEFMAKVSKGNRDAHFGFFSRPTKAKLAS